MNINEDMNEIRINYIKISFSSSFPCLKFIEKYFVKKRCIYVGDIFFNNTNYKCSLMRNLSFVNFTGIKSSDEIKLLTNYYCKLSHTILKSKVKVDSIFSTVKNVDINVKNFDKIYKYMKYNDGNIKMYPVFSGIKFKFNHIPGCGIYFKQSKKINMCGQKHFNHIVRFLNMFSLIE